MSNIRPYKIVCVSGYFDPLHTGHIHYLNNARTLGDKLTVILNSDSQRLEVPRMPLDERKLILENLKAVDSVVISIDSGPYVCETLRMLKPSVFAKGQLPVPEEVETCKENSIEVVSGVGSQLHLQDLLASLR